MEIVAIQQGHLLWDKTIAFAKKKAEKNEVKRSGGMKPKIWLPCV